MDSDQLLPYESLWAMDMFREVHQQVGACYATVMVLKVSLRRLEGISFWRTREQGQMTRDGTRLLQLLLPHIQLAMEIRYALGMAEARAIGAEAMANASRTATFLLTGRGEVLHMNAAANAQLAERNGLVVEKGILVASSAGMRASLKALLRDASQPCGLVGELRLGAAAGRALSLERRSGRPPLHLLASPVPYGQAGRSYAVLLLVTDPEKPVDVTDEMMRTYYGLTAAETEIANGLLTGYSLLEIAALRRVAVGTVRIQLKSLFAKTGTTRQVDLVRMLLTLPQISQTA
jgi:DNA-binding CsgD family transcriptional regulator